MTFFRKIVSVVVLIVMASFSAFGQGSGTMSDPYIMVDGGEYAFKVYNNFYGQFIIPEDVDKDGIVLELVADNWVDVYSDAELNLCISTTTGNFAPYTTTVNIAKGTAKGTVLYVYSDFPMNSGSVKVSYGGGSPLELVKVTPAAGSVLSAGESYVGFEFSKPVRFDACVMRLGAHEIAVEANQIDRFVSVEAKAQLWDAYKSGALKEGDELSFVLKNVATFDGKSVLGDVIVEYVAANKPVTLKRSMNTPDSGMPAIKSWMPVTEDLGLVQLVFDGKLNKEAAVNATLSFGDFESGESGEYYMEPITPIFANDSTLQFDLRGTLRIPSKMVASGMNYGSMLLTIRGVEDESGYKTYADVSGTSGAYFFNYAFEVVKYTIMTEFMPASGQCIDNYNEVTIWIQETGGNMSFTGALFEYVYEGVKQQVTVPLSEIQVTIDEEDEAAHYIIIPVPNFFRDADTTVSVSLLDAAYPDGMDYSHVLSAQYTTQGVADPTGIESIQQSVAKTVYGLDGKLVTSPLKSNTIYIINGRTTIIK